MNQHCAMLTLEDLCEECSLAFEHIAPYFVLISPVVEEFGVINKPLIIKFFSCIYTKQEFMHYV